MWRTIRRREMKPATGAGVAAAPGRIEVDAVTVVPARQRAGARLRPGLPGARPAAERSWPTRGERRRTSRRSSAAPTVRPPARAATSSSRTGTPRVLGTLTNATPPTSPTRSRPRTRAAAGLGELPFDERAAVFLRAADLLAGPWREKHRRRDHARPVQDRVPGRDRRALRADRLLAVQRRLRPADPGASSRSARRACGTASTTARWRASSTRSPRSTSPRSPATCRPRRR